MPGFGGRRSREKDTAPEDCGNVGQAGLCPTLPLSAQSLLCLPSPLCVGSVATGLI